MTTILSYSIGAYASQMGSPSQSMSFSFWFRPNNQTFVFSGAYQTIFSIASNDSIVFSLEYLAQNRLSVLTSTSERMVYGVGLVMSNINIYSSQSFELILDKWNHIVINSYYLNHACWDMYINDNITAVMKKDTVIPVASPPSTIYFCAKKDALNGVYSGASIDIMNFEMFQNSTVMTRQPEGIHANFPNSRLNFIVIDHRTTEL